MIALWRKFVSLTPSDRSVVMEAAALMALAWTGLRMLPFATVRRVLEHYIKYAASWPIDRTPAVPIATVRWAIGAVSARAPSASCLVQALAADAMLRRRHLPSEIRIGVRPRCGHNARLEGHAWVESGGVVTVGDLDDLSEFQTLAPARPR
jgi:transglutaminase superfamily protein